MAGYEYYTVQNIIKQDNKKEARVEREWNNKLYSEKDCRESIKSSEKKKAISIKNRRKEIKGVEKTEEWKIWDLWTKNSKK